MSKIHWMKHTLGVVFVTSEDQYGAPAEFVVRTFPARITYGDRYLSSTAGSAVLVAVMEAYAEQSLFSYIEDRDTVNIVEAENTLPETTYLVSNYDDIEATRNAINADLGIPLNNSSDWVTINRRSLKRSMNRRKRGYTYVARTGGE